jgi:hypothetical protein
MYVENLRITKRIPGNSGILYAVLGVEAVSKGQMVKPQPKSKKKSDFRLFSQELFSWETKFSS